MEKTKEPPEQDPKTGRFLPGNNGGPGRPRGARANLSEAFFRDLDKAWQDKGIAAIEAMIAERPHEFAKMIAGLQTKEISGEDGGAIEMSVSEVVLRGVKASDASDD